MPSHTYAKLLTLSPGRIKRVTFGGFGQIADTVKVKGTPDLPVRRRVRLIHERSGTCIAETWSDATTGAYSFTGIDPAERYTVVAYDGPRVYRAAIQDNIEPAPWP